MWEFHISIRSFADVREFVEVATVQPFAVTVGNGNHWVNGKSFIGMFSLDYHQPLTVSFSCSQTEYESFRTAAAKFVAA